MDNNKLESVEPAYTCDSFCKAIDSEKGIEFRPLLALMIHVTACLGELQDRLQNQSGDINKWKDDSLSKINWILGVDEEKEQDGKE